MDKNGSSEKIGKKIIKMNYNTIMFATSRSSK